MPAALPAFDPGRRGPPTPRWRRRSARPHHSAPARLPAFPTRAGSQRLRDVINKGLTNEELIRGAHAMLPPPPACSAGPLAALQPPCSGGQQVRVQVQVRRDQAGPS
jgi:hypothetical protein